MDESAPGAGLVELVAVMHRLRHECPWDARQTHDSLAPHLLEETYEALEALEGGNPAAISEELGDVLLQVFFHAEIASERHDGTGYTIDDVAGGIAAKLIRRHPHVFGDVSVSGAEEVKQNWDAIKAAERKAKGGGPGSVLDGVPFGQPALSLAAQLQRRAERAGAPAELARLGGVPGGPDGSDGRAVAGGGRGAPDGADGRAVAGGGRGGPDGADGRAVAGGGPGRPGSADGQAVAAALPGSDGAEAPEAAHPEPGGIGAELFALVARAREAGLDPELELRAAARAYRDRVQAWERQADLPAPPPLLSGTP